jgi:hypothetical protein
VFATAALKPDRETAALPLRAMTATTVARAPRIDPFITRLIDFISRHSSAKTPPHGGIS